MYSARLLPTTRRDVLPHDFLADICSLPLSLDLREEREGRQDKLTRPRRPLRVKSYQGSFFLQQLSLCETGHGVTLKECQSVRPKKTELDNLEVWDGQARKQIG